MKKELSFRHRLVCAIPYSLLHFLIEYNCLKQYLDNCCEQEDESFINATKRDTFPAWYGARGYFTRAFVWGKTKEGYNCWYNRSKWYEEYVRTKVL